MSAISSVPCLLAATLLLGMSPALSVATTNGSAVPFFFIQMADPQFGMFSSNADMDREIALFEQAIAVANRLDPAFVVVCGDLVNTPGDDTQAESLLQIASNLKPEIPLYWVPGNHDVGGEPTPDTQDWYIRHFGKLYYSFEHGNCQFIVLDTNMICHFPAVRHAAQRQWQWLSNRLAESSAFQHTILFQHHPWFLKDASEADGYFNVPQQRRARYLDILADKVTAVFAGHYHRNSYAKLGNMEMVTNGPVGKPLGEDPSGLRIVKVFEDHIEHDYYPLESVPDVIDLSPRKQSKGSD